MTITVLKPPPSFAAITATCRGCFALLQVDDLDDLAAGSFGTMGDFDWEIYFKCPLCKSNVFVTDGVSYALEQTLIQEALKRREGAKTR